LPLAFMVAYQMLPVFVFPHTTDTFDIFDTAPGFTHALPATNATLRARDESLLPHATTVANNAVTTTPIFHMCVKRAITSTFTRI
jgi:hypothetical protein